MMHRRTRFTRLSHRLVWFVLALACFGLMPRHAIAATCKASSAAPTLTVPSVTVMTSAPVGSKLGTPASVSVNFSCTGLGGSTATVQVGNLATRDASDPPPGGGISFATNVPGIALVLTATPVQASDNSCLRCGPDQAPGWELASITGTATTTATFTGQFMKTGPVTAGTVRSIQLAQLWWYIYGSTSSVSLNSVLTLASSTIGVQACSVNTDSTNLTVTLPTVSTQALRSSTAVAGRTGFKINLTCTPGANVSITMSTTKPGTATGTIVSTGTAGNVDVQLLDGSFNPVTFDTATSLGAAPSGTLSIPYYAQYYATGSAGAGSVSATATFTMTYQ